MGNKLFFIVAFILASFVIGGSAVAAFYFPIRLLYG